MFLLYHWTSSTHQWWRVTRRSASLNHSSRKSIVSNCLFVESERCSVVAASSAGGPFHFPLSVRRKTTLRKPCRVEAGWCYGGVPSWRPVGAQLDGWGQYRAGLHQESFMLLLQTLDNVMTKNITSEFWRRKRFNIQSSSPKFQTEMQHLFNDLSSSGLIQNRKKGKKNNFNSTKTFPNQLLALPVSSEVVDVQTDITGSLSYWRKLKNVMFPRQVLHMWGASLLRIYGVIISSMLMKLRWSVSVHRTFVELQLLRCSVPLREVVHYREQLMDDCNSH